MLVALLASPATPEGHAAQTEKDQTETTKRLDDISRRIEVVAAETKAVGEKAAKAEADAAKAGDPNTMDYINTGVTAAAVLLGFFTLRWLKRQTSASEDSAKAAALSAKTARDAMVVAERPWIGVDIGIGGGFHYEPLPDGQGNNWRVLVNYKLTHHGKTPASDVAINIKLIPMVFPLIDPTDPSKTIEAGTDIQKELEDICAISELMSDHKMGFSHVLFPGESEKHVMDVGCHAQNQIPGYYGQWMIVVGVTYRSTISPDDRYRTAKAFHFFKSGGKVDLSGEMVSPNELRLILHPTHGSYAR